MDYATLKTHIEDVCETSFTDAQLQLFTQQAEHTIYNSTQIPDLRKEATGTLTASTADFTLPSDFVYPDSFAVLDGSSSYSYLLNKDINFIREAYPVATTEGLPKHYALKNATTAVLGPTPDSTYTYYLQYGYYPESIVTASTTWLGDNFPEVLLNCALVEALRFMKGEQDLVALYDKLFLQSLTLLKNYSDGKSRQDTYRSGQLRSPVV